MDMGGRYVPAVAQGRPSWASPEVWEAACRTVSSDKVPLNIVMGRLEDARRVADLWEKIGGAMAAACVAELERRADEADGPGEPGWNPPWWPQKFPPPDAPLTPAQVTGAAALLDELVDERGAISNDGITAALEVSYRMRSPLSRAAQNAPYWLIVGTFWLIVGICLLLAAAVFIPGLLGLGAGGGPVLLTLVCLGIAFAVVPQLLRKRDR